MLQEDHGQPIFGIQINLNCMDSDPVIFATTAHNRVGGDRTDSCVVCSSVSLLYSCIQRQPIRPSRSLFYAFVFKDNLLSIISMPH